MPEFQKRAVLGSDMWRHLNRFSSVFVCRPSPLLSFHPGPYSYHCDSRVLYKVKKYLHSSYLALTLSKLALV